MSQLHPIISVIGASGSGKTRVKQIFYDFFKEHAISAAIVEGDSFHRFSRKEMEKKRAIAGETHRPLTHYSHYANDLPALEELFRTYSESGKGERRFYVHNEEDTLRLSQRFGTTLSVGDLSPKEKLIDGTQLLFYEGLHGVAIDHALGVNVAQYVDLSIGIVPTINLEWKQKLHRDTVERGYAPEKVIESITERLPDYIEYILPQFSRTHVNLQHIPLIDSSNPLALDEPLEEWHQFSCFIISTKNSLFLCPELLSKIEGARQVNESQLLIPGDKFDEAQRVLIASLLTGFL